MKTCTKCGETKPLDEFYAQVSCAGGLRPDCKQCVRDRTRRRARSPEDRHAEYLRNMEQYKSRARANHHRRRAAAGEVDNKEWETLLEWVDGRCIYCGAPWEHIDHIIPISEGGPHVIENVAPACAECNLSKGAKDPIEWYKERFGIDLEGLVTYV